MYFCLFFIVLFTLPSWQLLFPNKSLQAFFLPEIDVVSQNYKKAIYYFSKEAENIWESFLKDEIHNPQRSAGEKAVALLNLIWFEDTQLREKSGIPQQPFAELFHESKLGDTFSQEQCDYLVNHSHFDLGMITPYDHAELTSQIRNKFDVLMELNSQKKRLPEITNLDWHLIGIEILKNVMLSRREREGKPRIDYIGLAIEIVNDLRESN